MKTFCTTLIFSLLALLSFSHSVSGAALIRVAAGANPAAIQSAVDQFRIDLTGFSPPRNFSRVAPANTTSLIIGGLTKNKTYCGTMVSLNTGGESAPTNQSCTTTMR